MTFFGLFGVQMRAEAGLSSAAASSKEGRAIFAASKSQWEGGRGCRVTLQQLRCAALGGMRAARENESDSRAARGIRWMNLRARASG